MVVKLGLLFASSKAFTWRQWWVLEECSLSQGLINGLLLGRKFIYISRKNSEYFKLLSGRAPFSSRGKKKNQSPKHYLLPTYKKQCQEITFKEHRESTVSSGSPGLKEIFLLLFNDQLQPTPIRLSQESGLGTSFPFLINSECMYFFKSLVTFTLSHQKSTIN